MSTEDDLYNEESAQRVDGPPMVEGKPSKLENIMALGSKPAAKRGMILAAVAVLVAIALVAIATQRLRSPPKAKLPADITGVNVGVAPGSLNPDTQGGAGNTQQFQNMVKGVSQERVDQANRDGTSVQPLAITVERDLRTTPQPVAPAAPVYQQQAYQPPSPQDPAYAAMMANARNAVGSLVQARSFGSAVFDGPAQVNKPDGQAAQAGKKAGQGDAPLAPAAPQSVTMLAAGAMESVKMDTAMNSDVGGEAVATVVTGRYAGARVIGTATRVGDLLKPQFTLMSLPGTGISVPITAIGLDPQTLENGTATDVDRKLFVKYGVQPVAAALSALGQAIAQGGGTTVINGSTAVSSTPEVSGRRATGIAVGAAAGTFTKDIGALNTEPTVRIAKDTILGILFTRDVIYTPK